MSRTLDLARQLISRPSVTPDDGTCQEVMIDRLASLGFEIERLPFGEVTNFWARLGRESPLLVFAGHTDVVPTGPLDEWSSDPFTPSERGGLLYGRGAADMKGSLAAMVTASEEFLSQRSPKGSLGFLVTSDEEGPAVNGTVKVMDWLSRNGQAIDYCIVGEPSSHRTLGDTIKIGRRGSLSGRLTVQGVQGHVAYPELADNPIHRALQPLAELCRETWDEGSEEFPATSLQISNIHAGTGAGNVIPDHLTIDFNLRFSNRIDAEVIRRRCSELLDRHQLNYELEWSLSGQPFLTRRGDLIEAVVEVMTNHTGRAPELSTGGGTSDGRFIAPSGAQVVELGPCNASIHKVDEHVNIADLDALSRIYRDIIDRLL